MFEIEVRALIKNVVPAQDRLRELGFEEAPAFEQHDIIIDKPDASLFLSGQKIRIRIEKEEAELTYKGLFQGDGSASRRVETNVSISEKQIPSIIRFLEAIGYSVCFQVKKTRKIFHKRDMEVTFDEWPIIGNLVEIEGDEKAVKKCASKIAPEVEFRNYRLRELFQMEEENTGKTVKELKEEYLLETGFDLGKIELLVS